MQNHSISIHIDNEIAEITRVADAVNYMARDLYISQRTVNEMNVVLDEVLSNIIQYGYESAGQQRIRIQLSLHEDRFCAVIEDDGKPFDPTKQHLPPLNADAASRPIGGLGLHFVKALTDEASYSRVGITNRLRVCKQIAASGPSMVDDAFSFDVALQAGIAIIVVGGRLGSVNAATLHSRLLAIIADRAQNVIVDLTNVSYVASAGFWALLASRKKLDMVGGRLVLCGIKGEVGRLFDVIGLRDSFPIAASLEAAVSMMIDSKK